MRLPLSGDSWFSSHIRTTFQAGTAAMLQLIMNLNCRFRPVPSYTSAVTKDDFKAAAIFEEMEKTLKRVR